MGYLMRKNIVFLHMESLNQQVFANRQWFPAINLIYGRSLRLTRFISSATSTFMALSDMLHGDDMLLEHNESYDDDMTLNKTCRSIFDILEDNGYETMGTESPTGWDTLNHIWNDHNDKKQQWDDVCHDMMEKIEDKLKNLKAPLGLYFWNPTSHICCYDKYKFAEHGFDYWRRGWSNLDRSVNELIRLLSKYNQLSNTIIVAFGDHGDDFWTHDSNGGFAHAIEPYIPLIHTPAFIFGTGMPANDINHLVSLIDLKKITLQLLNIPDDDFVSSLTYTLSGGRKYCFSRNISAAQIDSKKNDLRKGYSITSDYLHLMKLRGKYELFSWNLDPGNHFNLLQLFSVKKNDQLIYTPDKYMKKPHEKCHVHYKSIIYSTTIDFISENYSKMKKELDSFIERKNNY